MSTKVAKMYGLCRRQREVFADRYEAGAVQKELSDAELYSLEQDPVDPDETPKRYKDIRGE